MRLVRVLVAHNRYRIAGGEDTVVVSEAELLRQNGHEVREWIVSNAELSRAGALGAALRAPHSEPSRMLVAREIEAFRPDVVHVHNFFPILTPSIYDACGAACVPVVQTLHNYRLLCPKATLFRDGQVCEICLERSPYWAVVHRCYRASRLQSLVPARMLAVNRRRRTWNTKVTRFIVLTEFARSKFVEGGIQPDRIEVKPNFTVPPPRGESPPTERRGALFVGRLSEEKGVAPLMEAWRDLSVPLRVVGEGSLPSALGRDVPRQIELLGRRPREIVQEEMARASFLVVPSLWYEGFPMVIVEAFACGLPAIVSRLGALAEIVEDAVTGLHVTPNDPADLAEKAAWAADNPAAMRRMGEAARRVYERKYTPAVNYWQLMAIYKRAMDSSHPGPGA